MSGERFVLTTWLCKPRFINGSNKGCLCYWDLRLVLGLVILSYFCPLFWNGCIDFVLYIWKVFTFLNKSTSLDKLFIDFKRNFISKLSFDHNFGIRLTWSFQLASKINYIQKLGFTCFLTTNPIKLIYQLTHSDHHNSQTTSWVLLNIYLLDLEWRFLNYHFSWINIPMMKLSKIFAFFFFLSNSCLFLPTCFFLFIFCLHIYKYDDQAEITYNTYISDIIDNLLL